MAEVATFGSGGAAAGGGVDGEDQSRDPELSTESIERGFYIDNLLVRIHFIIEMIWWTGLAPWDFEFPFPGDLISTFLDF